MRYFIQLSILVIMGFVSVASEKCDADGKCPPCFFCTASKMCVFYCSKEIPVGSIRCNSNMECAADHHCNEFNFCIQGAPAQTIQGDRCQTNADCASDHHCNEFHFCIPGAPRQGDIAKCASSNDCAPDHHCNEFHYCIPGAPRNIPEPNVECAADGS